MYNNNRGERMEKSIFSKVFMWMFVGLFITFSTGYVITLYPNIIFNIFGRGVYLWFAIAELILVIFLSSRIKKMSFSASLISFLIYSFVSGVTFSSIFLAYKMESIIIIFFITALSFLVLSVIGYVTKIDLSKLSSILLMMLVGIIIATLVNIFVGNTMFDLIISIVAVIVFSLYVLYDVQKIKQNAYGIEDENKLAIFGALELYLDFINLLIHLLQIFGDRN